jgi:hypothetical protein
VGEVFLKRVVDDCVQLAVVFYGIESGALVEIGGEAHVKVSFSEGKAQLLWRFNFFPSNRCAI